MFQGEYLHTMDKKNRIIIPSAFRSELGERFVITRGHDYCLYIFTEEGYRSFKQTSIGDRPLNNRDVRGFIRFFAPTYCEPDANGRILIPESLRAYAGITKDVLSKGLDDYIEIWDPTVWEKYISSEDFISGAFADRLG